MKILVLNSGSSSLKFQFIKMPSREVISSGLVERIGEASSTINFKGNDEKMVIEMPISGHLTALKEIAKLLSDPQFGTIKNFNEIDVVGHRVVHGGNKFTQTTEITPEVKKEIRSLFSLAPLHNPANLKGIEVAEEIFPQARQFAVFDTSFLQTLPTKAVKYAIPNKFYGDNIRVFGFHGISHKYVSERTYAFAQKPIENLITIHLGNGCSMTAIKNGKAIDHSLGFGPNTGLIMGTRCGDIDSSVIFYLMEKFGYSEQKVNDILTKESGMLGLTGYSDLRDIEDRASAGSEECKLALEMNAYRIKKYIGAYAAALNGLDAITFTAGIGENSDVIRKLVCTGMNYLGIELDQEQNAVRSKEEREISTSSSKVKVFVIPTNEELEIAEQTYALIKE